MKINMTRKRQIEKQKNMKHNLTHQFIHRRNDDKKMPDRVKPPSLQTKD